MIRSLTDLAGRRPIDRLRRQRKAARPPVCASQCCSEHLVLQVDVDTGQAAGVATPSIHARGAAQQDDVVYRGKRRARNGYREKGRALNGRQRDVAAVGYARDSVQGSRVRVRTEIAVAAEDNPSDSQRFGFKLKAGEPSHGVSLLPNVGPKQQFHRASVLLNNHYSRNGYRRFQVAPWSTA